MHVLHNRLVVEVVVVDVLVEFITIIQCRVHDHCKPSLVLGRFWVAIGGSKPKRLFFFEEPKADFVDLGDLLLEFLRQLLAGLLLFEVYKVSVDLLDDLEDLSNELFSFLKAFKNTPRLRYRR